VVTLVNDKGTPVPYKLVDNQDKTFRVEFEATVVGVHTINVFFANRPVPRSPLKIDVKTGARGQVTVKGLPEGM